MAKLDEDRHTFSTLELFRNDETARAPEPNPIRAAESDITPQIYVAPSAPEVSKDAS